jgi:hypothetical protein
VLSAETLCGGSGLGRVYGATEMFSVAA